MFNCTNRKMQIKAVKHHRYSFKLAQPIQRAICQYLLKHYMHIPLPRIFHFQRCLLMNCMCIYTKRNVKRDSL